MVFSDDIDDIMCASSHLEEASTMTRCVPKNVQRNQDECEPMVEQAIATDEVGLMEEMPYSPDALDIS